MYTLLSVAILTTIIGGLVLKANAADTETPDVTMIEPGFNNTIPPRGFDFRMGCGKEFARMGHRFGPNDNKLELSSEYTQKVEDILSNDTDVQNLFDQGYNVTTIKPVINRVVEADGTVTSEASTAIVSLRGTSGMATVYVDYNSAKVLKIVILTRTVIDKTTG